MSTPVQRQYWELKNQNPEAILFFRLGDFYELFFEDALLGSKLLGITLTARHKGTDNEMPMAGFPHHAHTEYLEKLIEAGHSVAIAEQVETEDQKIIRVVERVITPGTTLETGNLDPSQPNFLAAIFKHSDRFAIAYTDLSTGDFFTADFGQANNFWDEIYRLNPREILCPTKLYEDESFMAKLPDAKHVPRTPLKGSAVTKVLKDQFSDNHLAVAGIEKLDNVLSAAAMILDYVQHTQKKDFPHLRQIEHQTAKNTLALDAQTLRHLEIFVPLSHDDLNATLWSVFAKPATAMGARTLRHWILRPMTDTKTINARLGTVEAFIHDQPQTWHDHCKQIPDLERLLARLASQRGNARDLVYMGQALSLFPLIAEKIETLNDASLKALAPKLTVFAELTKTLQSQLVPEPPLEITTGGMFQVGVHERLDELRQLSTQAEKWLEKFVTTAKAESGISNLRVKYSKNFGYCLEVSKAQAAAAPDHWQRRQTLVNAERFTTPELAEYETKVLSATEEACALEHQLFVELRAEFLSYLEPLQVAAKAIGQLDATLTLARSAQTKRWVRPTIKPHSKQNLLKIKQGRHPVVESVSSHPFIPNDLNMNEHEQVQLITGPNMAGKSTFLRQNALIIILGQMGSFVPAESAEWSIVDRVFTRVGASDNLAAGQSTFFVEMSETASILHQATEQSFIILDEIGRGTSTFDGISLAWAITEYLHEVIKARTLFATHYHELIELADELPHAANYHVSVSQNQDGILFLRQIKPGGIADSFGIEVAKLAGVPKPVIDKSRDILTRLESENLLSGTPNLFAQPRVREVEVNKQSAVETKLSEVNPDDLSPKEALEVLYELKKSINLPPK